VIESIEQPHSCQFQRKTYSHKAEIPQVLHSHALVGEAAKLDEINPNSPMFFKKKSYPWNDPSVPLFDLFWP